MMWTRSIRSWGCGISACHLRQRRRQVPVPIGTPPEAVRFRWSRKELMHGSSQKDDTFAQSSSTQDTASEDKRQAQHNGQELETRDAEALVAARDKGERRARPEAWRVQIDQREGDRGLAKAFSRTQRAPQDRRLSLGAIDADILHQPRRQDAAEDAA